MQPVSIVDPTLYINSPNETIDRLYEKTFLPIEMFDSTSHYLWPNRPLVLKGNNNQSALGIVRFDSTAIDLVSSKIELGSITPRSVEQRLFASMLLKPSIQLCIALGRPGTGKTLLGLAAAIQQVLGAKKYERIILSKPMDTVGKIGLGFLPGDLGEKIGPYMSSYGMQFKELLGSNGNSYLETLAMKGVIEYIPIQLMRGMSFKNSFIIIDESQSLDRHEMLTICTRVGDCSKIVLLGDLKQRDRNISIEQSALFQLFNSHDMNWSGLTSSIILHKNERSPIVELIDNVLGENTLVYDTIQTYI